MLLVKTVQRYTINPLMRLLLAVGINPLGVAILETWGHASGKTRRVPVGNGRKGDLFWIIAEHASRAGYVRNIQHDPHVRVRLRIGLRYRWVPGIATGAPTMTCSPAAETSPAPAAGLQRDIRARFGADLLTVHVQINTAQAEVSPGPSYRAARRDVLPASMTARTPSSSTRHQGHGVVNLNVLHRRSSVAVVSMHPWAADKIVANRMADRQREAEIHRLSPKTSSGWWAAWVRAVTSCCWWAGTYRVASRSRRS